MMIELFATWTPQNMVCGALIFSTFEPRLGFFGGWSMTILSQEKFIHLGRALGYPSRQGYFGAEVTRVNRSLAIAEIRPETTPGLSPSA